jgi:hypothetical protein
MDQSFDTTTFADVAPPASRTARHAVAPRAAVPRHDIYAHIHKALRMHMGDTLVAVGRMDAADAGDVAAAAEQVRELVEVCRAHLDKEETWLHPAMEARAPGSSGRAAHDHRDHLQAFARLEADLAAVVAGGGAAAARLLYRDLGLFVAENLVHMHAEEIDNNAVLWGAYSDDEIRAIEATIVASLSPAETTTVMRWMVPAMNPAERAAMLGGMKAHAPEPAFRHVLATASPHLTAGEWRKLADALAL